MEVHGQLEARLHLQSSASRNCRRAGCLAQGNGSCLTSNRSFWLYEWGNVRKPKRNGCALSGVVANNPTGCLLYFAAPTMKQLTAKAVAQRIWKIRGIGSHENIVVKNGKRRYGLDIIINGLHRTVQKPFCSAPKECLRVSTALRSMDDTGYKFRLWHFLLDRRSFG
jgi:hypothetical protein